MMQVISLEEGKIEFLNDRVIKKTTKEEANFLLRADEFIKCNNNVNILSKKYKIHVPKFYDYKDNSLIMERCYGKNLELMLRDKQSHLEGVTILNTLFNFFLSKKIYWQDFAPRNIMISDNEIYIMDFERGIFDEVLSISDYFANTVYEEYAAFLLPDERIISLEDALKINNNYLIKINEIKSKRVKSILNLLGFEKMCYLSDYYFAIKMIITNEEPYKNNEEIIFPLIELENFLQINGYEEYCKKIIGGYNEKNRRI